MRLWHYALLSYLPDAQFKGQLRELVAIMHDWRDKDQTNHLLINRVMDYDKQELSTYFMLYRAWYNERYGKWLNDNEFEHFAEPISIHEVHERKGIYLNWHNKEYLRVCMANLYEKWKFGKGKSRITDEEWERLCDGYRKITGEEYVI